MSLRAAILAVGGLLSATACAPAVRPVSPAVVQAAHTRGIATDAAGLALGRATYVRACGTCHQLFSNDHLDTPGWRAAVADMAPRAHLTRADTDVVLAYLLAAHHLTSDHAPPSPPHRPRDGIE